MSKTRYENYLAISNGDMSAVTNYVSELEQQKSELIDMLQEFVNFELTYTHYLYDDAIKLLERLK